MWRKLGKKLSQKKNEKRRSEQGAAVPYSDPDVTSESQSARSRSSSAGALSFGTSSVSADGDGSLLADAALRNDVEGLQQLLSSGYDVDWKDDVSNNYN